jgi:hypothetical protein
MTALISSDRRRNARAPKLFLYLGVERVHRGPVEPDGADAVGDLQRHELAHEHASLSVG